MLRLAAILVLTATSIAHAQEPAAEPKLFAGASATIWLPQGDADDTSETSFGVRPVIGFWIRPFFAVIGAFDYIFVNEKGDTGDDITFYSLSLGGRVTTPKPARLKPYGELLLGRYTLDAAGIDSQSDIGFRIGGGATYSLADNIVFTAGLGYSSVSIDIGFGDADIDALVVELGLQGRF